MMLVPHWVMKALNILLPLGLFFTGNFWKKTLPNVFPVILLFFEHILALGLFLGLSLAFLLLVDKDLFIGTRLILLPIFFRYLIELAEFFIELLTPLLHLLVILTGMLLKLLFHHWFVVGSDLFENLPSFLFFFFFDIFPEFLLPLQI